LVRPARRLHATVRSHHPYRQAEGQALPADGRQLLNEGTDPSEHKKAAKQAQKVDGLTFETLARE
jgi:hypothetical protein